MILRLPDSQRKPSLPGDGPAMSSAMATASMCVHIAHPAGSRRHLWPAVRPGQ